jgi:hypothetical protein
LTSTWSASWKRRSNVRAAMPRCRNWRSFSSAFFSPRMLSICSLTSTFSSSSLKPATAMVIRYSFSPSRSML